MSATPDFRPAAESAPFWAGCARGELLFQQCAACGQAQFPPRGACVRCGAAGLAWARSAGLGVIHSYTVVHRAPTAEFAAETPYVIALVDLDEGFRIMTNLRGEGAPARAAIGVRVRIGFEDRGERPPLPQARIAGAG